MVARPYLFASHLAAVAIASNSGHSSAISTFNNPTTACHLLKASYANITLLPEDAGYTNETQVPWSAAAWLSPACVFTPRDAHDLSFAVKTFVNTSTPFAMRGGGHMPIDDAANINSTGVLISSTNLKTLKLSEDKETISIGPGPRWGDVYSYLDGTNLTVVGGRYAPVGVPGLLLGGGMSWYSYKNGQSSAGGKIKAYEVVLSDGTIATVTANSSYSDLYWALQGGGNSFALVTRFDLQTFYAGTPLIADATYAASNTTRDAWLATLLDFTLNVDADGDTAAATIPVARWGPNFTEPLYQTTLFYNGSTAPSTGPFADLINGTKLQAVNGSSTLKPVTLAQYGSLLTPEFKSGGQSYGLFQKFRVVSIKATKAAMDIVHDTYFDSLQASGLANSVPGFFTGLAFNCVTKSWAEASAGVPQNIPPEAQFWVEKSLTWASANDTARIEAWMLRVSDEIDQKLEVAGLKGRYTYLNDADKGQEVFETYGEENLNRLKSIRAKYDPGRVYTDLMPGGFKVANA